MKKIIDAAQNGDREACFKIWEKLYNSQGDSSFTPKLKEVSRLYTHYKNQLERQREKISKLILESLERGDI